MNINKDSKIVEVFSADLLKRDIDTNEVKDANDYVRELSSNPTPNNRYEIAQIMRYVIDQGFNERVRYMEEIADVKRTGYKEKAQFEVEIDDLKAMFQAKSASTERSKISSKYFTLDTDEVSIRPVVDFLDLASGKVDFNRIAERASAKLELEVVKRIQSAVYSAFSAMSSPNYTSGSGVSATAFDPILSSMLRVGGNATILGDVEALSKFTGLTGFNNDVPDEYMIQHNENGMLGTYKGGRLVKLNNPFVANSLTETELRKDLLYVVPSGEAGLRPIKVQFEGELQSMESTNIDSKKYEMRFDQYVGVSAIGVRKLMGVYEDTSL